MDSDYRVLGLTRSATEKDVRKAFKLKALQYHPDRNPNGAELFKRLNQAYEALQEHFHNGGRTKFGDTHRSKPFSFAAMRPRPCAAHSTPLFSEAELFANLRPAGKQPDYSAFRAGFRSSAPRNGAAYGLKGAQRPSTPPTPPRRHRHPLGSGAGTANPNVAAQRELESEWAREREQQSLMRRAAEQMKRYETAERKAQARLDAQSEWEQYRREAERHERSVSRRRRQAEMTKQEQEISQAEAAQRVFERRLEEQLEETLRMRAEEQRLMESQGRSRKRYETENNRSHSETSSDENHDGASIAAELKDLDASRLRYVRSLLPSQKTINNLQVTDLYRFHKAVDGLVGKVGSLLADRLKYEDLCLSCRVQAPEQNNTEGTKKPKFKCNHAVLCLECLAKEDSCPLCGAEKIVIAR